jgi:hypothetical protein
MGWSSSGGKNTVKMLVESAYAIFDTLRQGIPKYFPDIFPATAGNDIGGSNLAFFGREKHLG